LILNSRDSRNQWSTLYQTQTQVLIEIMNLKL